MLPVSASQQIASWSGPAFLLGIPGIQVKVSDMSTYSYQKLIPVQSHSKTASHVALASWSCPHPH